MSVFGEIVDHVNLLGKRKDSFNIMLDHLMSSKTGPVIIETGCMRQEDSYEGDGMSTSIWHKVCQLKDGYFHSFDINPDAVAFARSKIYSDGDSFIGNINLVDSVAGINSLFKCNYCTKGIDLLYLDSVDLNLPDLHKSFLHNMFEFTSAVPLLKTGALICVDDNVPFDMLDDDGKVIETRNISKGDYLKRYMEKIGIQPLYEGYQLIWRWM